MSPGRDRASAGRAGSIESERWFVLKRPRSDTWMTMSKSVQRAFSRQRVCTPGTTFDSSLSSLSSSDGYFPFVSCCVAAF